MEARVKQQRGGNLRWAVALAGGLVALWVAGLPLVSVLGGPRVTYCLMVLVLVVAPFALVWLVGETHLRWSPEGRAARTLVGWILAAATLTLLVLVAPVALYLLVHSAGYVFGE